MLKTHEEFRASLIMGAIEAVSRNGIESLTTRQICKEAEVNEAYIYRYFFDKEDLLKKAFIYADSVLVEEAAKEISAIIPDSENTENDVYRVLSGIQNSLMKEKRVTLFFYSLYYSRMLPGMIEEHNNLRHTLFMALAEKFPSWKINRQLTDAVYECLMNGAAKTHLGLIKDSAESAERLLHFLLPAAAKAFGI